MTESFGLTSGQQLNDPVTTRHRSERWPNPCVPITRALGLLTPEYRAGGQVPHARRTVQPLLALRLGSGSFSSSAALWKHLPHWFLHLLMHSDGKPVGVGQAVGTGCWEGSSVCSHGPRKALTPLQPSTGLLTRATAESPWRRESYDQIFTILSHLEEKKIFLLTLLLILQQLDYYHWSRSSLIVT